MRTYTFLIWHLYLHNYRTMKVNSKCIRTANLELQLLFHMYTNMDVSKGKYLFYLIYVKDVPEYIGKDVIGSKVKKVKR